MDVFKTRPGTRESIMITPENVMSATRMLPPYCVENGDRTSYYAVCPLCDNPIQIVGLNKQEGESAYSKPYGRHHRGDVPGVARYDEDAYLNCPYADPYRRPNTRKRKPKDPTGLALYGIMRDEFDHVVHAWEAYSGIHLSHAFARRMLELWRGDETWRYYIASYRNLPQTLFYGKGARNLVGRYVKPSDPIAERLGKLPQVRLDPVPGREWVQIGKRDERYLDLMFMLHAHHTETDGAAGRLTETFRLCTMLSGRTVSDAILETDPQWLEHAAALDRGRRDRRLLDIADRILR